jgi:hypothetical protein
MPEVTLTVVASLLPLVFAGWACRMVFHVWGWSGR